MVVEMRGVIVLTVALLLGGCGQMGKLYLPEQSGEVVTRPTQTPPEPVTPPPPASDPEKDKDKKDGAGKRD